MQKSHEHQKVDITLSARAARHLYMTTAMVGGVLIVLGCLWMIISAEFSIYYSRHDWLGLLPSVAVVTLLAGSPFVLYRARRQLNRWAYVIAALCAAILMLIAGWIVFGGFDLHFNNAEDAQAQLFAILFFLLFSIYMLRVIIDFCRMALSRYDALDIALLEVAGEVENFLRNTRSSVPWFHIPVDPVRTFVYAIFSAVSLVPAIILLGVFPGALFPIAMAVMARRHYVFRAHQLLELDNRRPILFLRSFEEGDTQVRLWGRGCLGKFRRRTIDEAISWFAERLGPFVAIANPNTRLPRLGAAQSFFSNDTWQDAIARWAAMAQLIVMVAGRTEGIGWELDHIFSSKQHRKLVVFFPPALRDAPTAATQWLSDHFSNTRYGANLSIINPKSTVAVSFGDEDLFIIEARQTQNPSEVDYLIAFQIIVFAVFCKAPEQQLAQAMDDRR